MLLITTTSDFRKTTEEELNDSANLKELNDFSYLRKIKESRGSLMYRYHINLNTVLDVIDLSKKIFVGLFAIKCASRYHIFKGDAKNYRRWIYALKDIKQRHSK